MVCGSCFQRRFLSSSSSFFDALEEGVDLLLPELDGALVAAPRDLPELLEEDLVAALGASFFWLDALVPGVYRWALEDRVEGVYRWELED